MLVLTRKVGEGIRIGDGIRVVLLESKGNHVKIGIEAPAETGVYRDEVYLRIMEENKKAASVGEVAESDLTHAAALIAKRQGGHGHE